MSCPEGELFCDLIGDCVHIFGQECAEADFCCVKDDSTTQEGSSTTLDPGDCQALCEGEDIGFAGTCCGKISDKNTSKNTKYLGLEYCDCSSNVPMSCQEGELFCDYIGDCVHVTEEECSEAEYCCSHSGSTSTNMPEEECEGLVIF